jgi:hypothetical protein
MCLVSIMPDATSGSIGVKRRKLFLLTGLGYLVVVLTICEQIL